VLTRCRLVVLLSLLTRQEPIQYI